MHRSERHARLRLAVALPMMLVATAAMAELFPPQLLVPNTTAHPRNGEGDIIALKNGDLLLGYGRWGSNGDDFGAAEIWSKTSHNGGKTWGEDRLLVANEGKVTTFEVGFLRLRSGAILLSYCTKDSNEDCSICFRTSTDEGRSWRHKVKYQIPKPYTGYTAINNGRLIQLRNGRILLAAYDGWVRGTVIVSFVIYSDDEGKTWQKSSDVDIRAIAPSNRYGADEPAVVELKDGRVMLIARTDLGVIVRAFSSDRGATWSQPEPIPGLISPSSPASIGRIPQTGDLLLVWNNSKTARNPLNSAISHDEGQTWDHIRTVDHGAASFCYTSLTPFRNRMLLTYYGKGGFVLRSLPVRWFYQPESTALPWSFEGTVQEIPGGKGWRIMKRSCLFIQDMPRFWNGAEDSTVEATIRLFPTTAGRQASAMLWVGDQAPNMSCALYLRGSQAMDAVSFRPNMAPRYDLGDAGKVHRYRLRTNHAAQQVELFVDDKPQPVLTAPLEAVLGAYNLNRILYGDPNVDSLGGSSELLSLSWKNGR